MARAALVLGFAAARAADIPLATFDGADPALTHTWKEMNDPVMGGASTGTFSIENGIGIMNGTVALIPYLQAPGFIKTDTQDSKAWPDVSSCTGLALTTRSTSMPGRYSGYRVSFGTDSAFMQCHKFFARGFKANFVAGEGSFSTVQVPFNQFTKCWDDATGDAITTCAQDSRFCPTDVRLKNLQTLSIWAEGKTANVKLEVKSVSAYGCERSFGEGQLTSVSLDGAAGSTFI